ncbi:MAG: RDD family protein [Bacteriovoracaceae bacterium]
MNSKDPIIKYHNQIEDFSSYSEARFHVRALAFFIDAVILGVFQTAFTALYDHLLARLQVSMDYYVYVNVFYVFFAYVAIPSAYFIPQMLKSGQTVGKRVLRIRVILENNEGDLSSGRIFLREIIGKFVSAVFFGAGYIVRLFGLDTFHDKMAKTKVISLKVVD